MAANSMRKRSFVKDTQSRQWRRAARLRPRIQGRRAEQSPAGQGTQSRRLPARVRGGGLGRPWDRPELHRMLDHLREGDTVVVWKLDRLSRSLKDVLHIMERIAQAGAGFLSITENIDTTTPAGRMMMQMIGSFAEFERAMIRERTSAGIAAARAEGRLGGRRKKLEPPNGAKSPRASSPAGNPAPRWHASTISASRPCHGLSPSIGSAARSSISAITARDRRIKSDR